MKSLKVPAIVVAVLVVAGITAWVVDVALPERRNANYQATLEPFYTPPSPIPAAPGTLIRSEPLGVSVPGANAYRILYVSQSPSDQPVVSSGLLFVPTSTVPASGRPIVAWAHGTVGLGPSCAPSRSQAPLDLIGGWVQQMVGYGWIVVATDYAALGTPGESHYLVGESEARDVVNSVRAARQFPNAGAGTLWAVWGHSQGGHSALWTGALASRLAPELQLVAVAAAAPAAELVALVSAQWDKPIAWVIGADVALAWPFVYRDLRLAPVLSRPALSTYRSLANDCIQDVALAVAVRTRLGETFFAFDPKNDSAWQRVMTAQTPTPLPASLPVYLAQSTADNVVLPDSTALLQRKWCAAGSTLTMQWMGQVSHHYSGEASGPAVATWLFERFAGAPATSTCNVPPPVAPTPGS
jgi:hypothetical protein